MVTRQKRGDSAVQRKAELVIKRQVEKRIGLKLGSLSESAPELLGKIKLDGFCNGKPPICVEIWAHQGKAKPAQKDKIMKDMCKLLLVEKKLKKPCRKIFAVSDKEAIVHLKKSWQGEFVEVIGVEVCVINIPKAIKLEVIQAQKKQYR